MITFSSKNITSGDTTTHTDPSQTPTKNYNSSQNFQNHKQQHKKNTHISSFYCRVSILILLLSSLFLFQNQLNQVHSFTISSSFTTTTTATSRRRHQHQQHQQRHPSITIRTPFTFTNMNRQQQGESVAGYKITPLSKRTILHSSNTISTTDDNDTTTTTPQQQTSSSSSEEEESNSYTQVSFSHIQLYVDQLQDIQVYKQLEHQLNSFATMNTLKEQQEEEEKNQHQHVMEMNIDNGQSIWNTITNDHHHHDDDDEKNERSMEFISQNRDVVKQLISGLGFRITGIRYPTSSSSNGNTRSVLLTTKDLNGVQFIISSQQQQQEEGEKTNEEDEEQVDDYTHFDVANIQEFYKSHSNRQGIAVLGFQVKSGMIESLYQRYQQLHPNLIPISYQNGIQIYKNNNNNDEDDDSDDGSEEECTTKVLEVYAYYKEGLHGIEADLGTKLRFIQVVKNPNQKQEKDEKNDETKMMTTCVVPGLVSIPAIFDETCQAAYCDHWVSNVVSRTGFIDTLEDVLGFQPKVDFNAGVVAAGEAQIESTVTGNDSIFSTLNKNDALQDQSQVFLPINNALSEVGHVHGFLQEIGQGIQHIASRVDDLAKFVQRGNDYRTITGEGFTFLKIPRSYYGVLTENQLIKKNGSSSSKGKKNNNEQQLSQTCATAILEACEKNKIITPEGAVDLTLSKEDITNGIIDTIDKDVREEFDTHRDDIIDTILKSRYTNLYNLLGENVNVETYLALVRNQILVDVQGGDILFQIFTSNILQRNAGDEAPFFEFIQRVCSDCVDSDGKCVPIKPGCGGFGIRNFLTLFLSIEVGKAMLDVSSAKSSGDMSSLKLAQRRVDTFTDQLNESNPILTEIADAMTSEGNAIERQRQATLRGDDKAAAEYEKDVLEARALKIASNEKLMSCSAKYNDLMKSLRVSSI